jgi:hypothetical protein
MSCAPQPRIPSRPSVYTRPTYLPTVSSEIILHVASPATTDFLVELSTKFQEIIVEKLRERSRKAITNLEDPDSMTVAERKCVRNDILQTLYGKCYCLLNNYFFASLI